MYDFHFSVTELLGRYLLHFRRERSSSLNIQIPAFQTAQVTLTGVGGSLSSLSATIDDYVQGAFIAPRGPLTFQIIPRAGVAAAVTVNVTITGKSMNGTVLPVLVVSADLAPNANSPQATAVAIQSSTVGTFTGDPSDPGSATIAIALS